MSQIHRRILFDVKIPYWLTTSDKKKFKMILNFPALGNAHIELTFIFSKSRK